MSGERLPKRIVFGNLERAVRRGPGGKEKEWSDYVQSDLRAFSITENWKATTLEAEVWVETVAEGGRMFMTAWRKEFDAARHREKKREAARLGRLLSHTEAENLAKRHPLAQSTSRRNPCADARRIETCVPPRHVDASRDFYFILFSPNDARLFSFFFPCSADHERDWPPCKVFFRVGNQNAGM